MNILDLVRELDRLALVTRTRSLVRELEWLALVTQTRSRPSRSGSSLKSRGLEGLEGLV